MSSAQIPGFGNFAGPLIWFRDFFQERGDAALSSKAMAFTLQLKSLRMSRYQYLRYRHCFPRKAAARGWESQHRFVGRHGAAGDRYDPTHDGIVRTAFGIPGRISDESSYRNPTDRGEYRLIPS